MIQTDDQLNSTRRALEQAERIMQAVHRTRTTRPMLYRLQAVAAADLIRDLRAQIDAYTGFTAAEQVLAEAEAADAARHPEPAHQP